MGESPLPPPKLPLGFVCLVVDAVDGLEMGVQTWIGKLGYCASSIEYSFYIKEHVIVKLKLLGIHIDSERV